MVASADRVDPLTDIDIKFKDSDESIPPSAQILGVAILEFGIVFHSVSSDVDSQTSRPVLTWAASSVIDLIHMQVIIGLTIAISRNNQFNTLFIVIIFHRAFIFFFPILRNLISQSLEGFEGLGLGKSSFQLHRRSLREIFVSGVRPS